MIPTAPGETHGPSNTLEDDGLGKRTTSELPFVTLSQDKQLAIAMQLSLAQILTEICRREIIRLAEAHSDDGFTVIDGLIDSLCDLRTTLSGDS